MSEPTGTPIESASSVKPKTLLEQDLEMLRARDAKNAVVRAENEARRKKENADFQVLLATKRAEAEARLIEKARLRCSEAQQIVKAATGQAMCFQDRSRVVKCISDWDPERFDFAMPRPAHPECTDKSPHRHCRTCERPIPADMFVMRLSSVGVGLVDASDDFARDLTLEYPDLCPNCQRKARFEDFIARSGWGTKANCGKCKNGWVIVENPENRNMWGWRLCDCWVQEKLGKNLAAFWDASLTDFLPSVQKAVGSWLQNLDLGRFITGIAGLGKTRLAIAIFKVVYLQWGWRDAIYRRCNDVYDEIKQTFLNSGQFYIGERPTEASITRKLTDCSLLVLDDVATGNGSDFEKRVIFNILDQRRNGMRPTIVISNFGPAKIAEHFNEPREAERITSRIAGLLEITWLGEDWRIRPSNTGKK